VNVFYYPGPYQKILALSAPAHSFPCYAIEFYGTIREYFIIPPA